MATSLVRHAGVSPSSDEIVERNSLSIVGGIVGILVLAFGAIGLMVWLRGRQYKLYSDLNSCSSNHTNQANDDSQLQHTSSGGV